MRDGKEGHEEKSTLDLVNLRPSVLDSDAPRPPGLHEFKILVCEFWSESPKRRNVI
jgi:hypothetical protein